MTKITSVFYSGYGHPAKQAEAVHAGAASVAEATLYRIDENGDLPEEAMGALAGADAMAAPPILTVRPANSKNSPTPKASHRKTAHCRIGRSCF